MKRVKDPKLESFCGSGSLGQNIVLVDQQHQLPAAGRVLKWDTDRELQFVAAKVPGVADGVDHTRLVALCRGVVVVLDKLERDAEHDYDFVYHNFGKLTVGKGWEATAATRPLGKTANYENLIDPQRLTGEGTLTLEWAITDNAKLRLWHRTTAGEIYCAVTGMNNLQTRIIPDRAPSLIHRVRGKTVTYATVLAPHRGQVPVTDVRWHNHGGVTIDFADSKTVRVNWQLLD